MRLLSLIFLMIIGMGLTAQTLPFEPSNDYPYGQPNPEAGASIEDWAPMIGLCTCQSVQRNPDGTWKDTISMDWTWKYILNGTAVQDLSLKEGSLYATSIRQYHPDSSEWIVTFFSYPGVAISPGTWRGGKQTDGTIVLSQPQKAPNGMDGFSRLTFYDINDQGYRWKGEWVKDDETVIWPFWHINCSRP